MSRVVWFHPRPWGPPQGGGDLRTQGLVTCAVAAGHQVLMVVPEGDAKAQTGVSVATYAGPRGAGLAMAKVLSGHPLRSPRATRAERSALAARISDFAPDVAVVSEVMGWSVACGLVPPRLPLVYDSQNLEGPLFRRLARDARGVLDRVTLAVDARRVASEEDGLLTRADRVLAVSAQDRDAFLIKRPGLQVVVAPSSVPTPPDPAVPAAAGPLVLFVGTLDYGPNVAAVLELAETILPEVRRTVAARLRVVGRRAVPAIRDLAGRHTWLELVEDAPDLARHYRSARCVVLPIRSGGGTKLKAYEALSWGVPVVSTPEAVAGIDLVVGDVLLASAPDELAAHATSVLADDRVAAELGARARATFLARLSWETATCDPLDRVLRGLAGS